MTTNFMRFLSQANPVHYRVDPGVNGNPGGTNEIKEGDIVWFDSAGPFIRPYSGGAGGVHGSFVPGVAEGVGNTPTSNIDNVTGRVTTVKVRTHGVFTFNKTTGDSLVHGDALVVGADQQTVLKQTSEPATEVIGVVWRPEASAALTGAGVVDVLFKANFPNVTFSFATTPAVSVVVPLDLN